MYIVNNDDLSKKAYNAIKTMILEGKLHPGAKLYQEKLAEELGISRTPLNGALNQLEKEMLVCSLPRRGFYVNEMSLEDLIEVYEIRKRLDPLCASTAALNNNQKYQEKCTKLIKDFDKSNYSKTDISLFYEFYSLIISMSGNNYLENMMTSYNLISLVNLNKYILNNSFSDRDLINPEEYKSVLTAIVRCSPELAEKTMYKHILNIYNTLVQTKETET